MAQNECIENWRPVPDAPRYSVSDQGRVRGVRGTILKPRPIHSGYLYVGVAQKPRAVHRLVASAFLGPRPSGLEVCHNDGDKSNNAVSNLRYDTHAANIADLIREGRHVSCLPVRRRTLEPAERARREAERKAAWRAANREHINETKRAWRARKASA